MHSVRDGFFVDQPKCPSDEGHEWKRAVEAIDTAVLDRLAKIVCQQTNCMGRGVDDARCGVCIACADCADNVVGEFILLTR